MARIERVVAVAAAFFSFFDDELYINPYTYMSIYVKLLPCGVLMLDGWDVSWGVVGIDRSEETIVPLDVSLDVSQW